MADLDAQLERAQADGRLSPEDADEVRNFAGFLEAAGPGPGRPGFDRRRFGQVYREHYPDDYARAIAEQQARNAGESDQA